MKYIEVRTALRTASKTDLFGGDVHNMRAKQWVKENVTVFYLDWETNQLSGPHLLREENDFFQLYQRMTFSKVGVIIPMPNVVSNEFLFDMVLREASIDDLKDTPRHIKLNRIYYVYAAQKLTGPFYTDKSTTSLFLENLVAKKQIFVPNERQHFKLKEYQKTA